MIETGWFDDNGMGSTQALDLTKDYPKGMRKAIIGPWIHDGNSSYDLHGVPVGDNALRYDLDLWYFRWFEQHLKGNNCIAPDTPTIEYFTVGEYKWNTAEQWPPESTEEFFLYQDNENLALQKPEAEGKAWRLPLLHYSSTGGRFGIYRRCSGRSSYFQ